MRAARRAPSHQGEVEGERGERGGPRDGEPLLLAPTQGDPALADLRGVTPREEGEVQGEGTTGDGRGVGIGEEGAAKDAPGDVGRYM